MKITEIKVPQLGESVVEATIARWVKAIGDTVQVDELLVEIETDKVSLEITAPEAGVLVEILAQQGQTVCVQDVIARMSDEKDASIAVATTANSAQSVPETSAVETATISAAATVTEPQQTITLEVTQQVTTAPSSIPVVDNNLREKASPSVRKRLAEQQMKAEQVQASRLDGRITAQDIKNVPQSVPPSVVATPAAVADTAALCIASVTKTSTRQETRVPMTRLRSRIAQRLKDAQNTAAILTTFNEIDMSAVKAMREKYKDSFEKKYGVKLGFMSFFVKACVKALQDVPMLNARIEGNEIISTNYCDIGVAVSAPNGLVVPVLRDADMMDLQDIEAAIMGYGKKAKENKLSLDDLSGGTFTISNGGVFGSLLSTPIINPPQSGILGMHKIQDRPVVVAGEIVIRPMMYVALSYDHRLVDGREAVTFLVNIKESIENPDKLLLGL